MHIRTFDGSVSDARGIIEVDRAAFHGCPYTPEYIVALESDPQQFAWVAEAAGSVVGFASAFSTRSLAADRWELDLVAVHPSVQGRGAGTALVARAVQDGIALAAYGETRAVVATDNLASQRVFTKNGYRPADDVDLVLYEVSGRVPRPARDGLPAVRKAVPDDARAIARLSACPEGRVRQLLREGENVYLAAHQESTVLGYVELLPVRTLEYRGLWVESLAFAGASPGAARALLTACIEAAKADERIDEVGSLLASEALDLYEACVAEGFRKAGEYRCFIRGLDKE